MQEELNKLLENHELVEKIIFHYKKWGKTSPAFLMNKFKINPSLANRIAKVVIDWEKREPQELGLPF